MTIKQPKRKVIMHSPRIKNERIFEPALRERIAINVPRQCPENDSLCRYSSEFCFNKITNLCTMQYTVADTILADPEIKEALALLELKRQGKLYKSYGGKPNVATDPLYRVKPL